MNRPSRLRLAARAALLSTVIAASSASAAANHVVIGEYATRGPGSATDEFVELYNPTANPIAMGGWKLQYSAGTNGTTWGDRAVLPSNAVIPAHGFYLVVNQSYTGSTTADYSSGLWNSGTGMADASGHERLIDASAVEVDKVGWGTAVNPEGSPAPAMTLATNSVERKALATSTADSLFAGAHALLGNGQDTNNNAADFVLQTHGRNPQNSSNAPEPAFAIGGNGTGSARLIPATVFTDRALDSLKVAFRQDSSYTLVTLRIVVPPVWTWSHSNGSVVLSGSAFSGAFSFVSGDTVFVGGATLSPTDSGTVTITDLTTPSANGGSLFAIATMVDGGTLAPIALQPSVRVLELVPIVTVHVNDSSGVPAAPYASGSEATVSGIVTANYNDTRTDVYVQDETAGINLFNAALGSLTLAPGDSITVTGSILQFRGLTELQPEFALLTRHATGRPIPDPLVITCAQLNATFHPDWTEPNEGRLVRINGVTYNPSTSTITDATGTSNIFIPNTFPAVPSVFDVVGILKQFKPGTPAPGPPYTADYEITPRTPDDIIAHPGPILLSTPYEDHLQPTSVQIHWLTDVASTSVVRFGLTGALGDSAADSTPVTSHTVTVTGLSPATVYSYSAGSSDANGANFSPIALFSTASPAQSTGVMQVYFNKSVDTSVAWLHPANGNQDLVARLTPHLDNAKRSIDAALYSLSGTPGAALASALIAAKNRGIRVRIIGEYDNINTTAFNSLVSAGIPLINDRFDPINFGAGLMHNKFLVIDGRAGAPESAWVWTGSWNPTDPGTNDDLQNSIEIQDQALANAYTIEFNEMWGSSTDTPNSSVSRFGARKLDDTPHRFAIGGRNIECYFSPSDGVTSHILSVVSGAQHSVGFELLTLTRSDIADALITRKNAGVAVRGDLDNSSDTGSQYAYLVGNGVDVGLKTGVSGLLHHKYCIVDAENPNWNSVTLTGSHNWSSSAETSNNENTIIIHDFDITNQYLQEFRARYHQFGGSDPINVGVDTPAGPPLAFALGRSFPNPARDLTTIEYALPSARRVALRLYDLQGREVRTLVNRVEAPGRHRALLSTRGLSSGVYFYRLESGGQVLQQKLLHLE